MSKIETVKGNIGLKDKINKFVNERIDARRYLMILLPNNTVKEVIQDSRESLDIDYNDGYYTLNEPAFIYLGKPLYIIREGFNISISLLMLDDSKQIEKWIEDYGKKTDEQKQLGNSLLVEKPYSPNDMKAVLESQTANRVFKIGNKVGKELWLTIILWSIIVSMTSVIICLPFIFGGR